MIPYNDITQKADRRWTARLLRHLGEPPPVTWALHIALLNAAANLRLPLPDVAALWAVDNLDLQAALCRHLG